LQEILQAGKQAEGPVEAIEWLEQKVFGFGDLTRSERTAINHFQLLWSLFEGRVLDKHGNAGAILEAMQQMAADGRLQLEPLAPALAHFRKRYVDGAGFTYHFDHLNLRGEGLTKDKPALVKAVLKGETNDPAEIAAAIFIIVYRYRNNLHHGFKWVYAFKDQKPNFRYASQALMAIMDMWGMNHD
jgi:hypothetical protein